MDEPTLYQNLNSLLYATNSLVILPNTGVDPTQIQSGTQISAVSQNLGNLASGKILFTDTEVGYWLGIDKDGKPKFNFGNSTNYISFDGSTVTIEPALSVGSLNIPDTTTASSFHVNTAGDTWWGCDVADFVADHNNAVTYILSSGKTKFTTGTSGAIISANSSLFSLIDNSTTNVGNAGTQQDFSSYTIVGTGVNAYSSPTKGVSFTTQPRNATAYAYKDFTVGYFGDFTQYATVTVGSGTASGGQVFSMWSMWNGVGDFYSLRVAYTAGLSIVGSYLTATTYGLGFNEYNTSGGGNNASFTATIGQPYYLIISRNRAVGTYGTAVCKIYSDSAHIHLLATLTLTLTQDNLYQYLYGYQSTNDGGNTNVVYGFTQDVYIGVTLPSVTGITAQIVMPSSTTATEQFLIDRRSSIHSQDDGILEFYAPNAPANSGLNYIFLGREGYGDSSTWQVSDVNLTTCGRIEFDHISATGPAYLITKTADSSNVGNGGLGTAGAIRQTLSYQPSNSFVKSNPSADALNVLTGAGGGYIGFGYFCPDILNPYNLQLWCDTAGIHFGDNVDFTYAGAVTGFPSYQEVTFTSTGTWVCPRGVTSIYVDMMAGGGGGAGSPQSDGFGGGGGGGGGGSLSNQSVTVVPLTDYTITVGAGGTVNGAGGTGNQGGTTSCFSYSVTGGHGGGLGTAGGSGGGTGGAGGDASAGAGGNGGSGNTGGSNGGNGTGSGGTGGNGGGPNELAGGGGGGGGGAGGLGSIGGNGGAVTGRSSPGSNAPTCGAGGGGSGGPSSASGGTGGGGLVVIKIPTSEIY